MCMLRSFLLASQWAGAGGREEGKKRRMAERKMREGTGKLAGYSIQIRAGNRRDERNERKRLNRNECGYEEAHEREKRRECCLEEASKTTTCQDTCLPPGNGVTHQRGTCDNASVHHRKQARLFLSASAINIPRLA